MSHTGGYGNRSGGRMAAAGRAVLLASAVFLIAPLAQAAPDGDGKLSPEVGNRARGALPGDLIAVIVQTQTDPSEAHLVRLQGQGGALKRRHRSIRGYSAVVPVAALA